MLTYFLPKASSASKFVAGPSTFPDTAGKRAHPASRVRIRPLVHTPARAALLRQAPPLPSSVTKMSAPLPFYQSRDAAVRQTFFDAATATAAAAVSSAAGSPSPTAPPPPLPPPPPGHSGRQQQSAGGNSSSGRANNGSKISGTAARDKSTSRNTSATATGTGTSSSADETHDTAALLQLHLQLNQHLQRGQQLVSDADIIRALKRIALNGAGNSGAPEPPPPPPCASRGTEQQQIRGKSSGSNYTSASNGYQAQSYGRGGNDRSMLSVREVNSGSNTGRGSAVGTAIASTNQGGQPPAPPSTGSNTLALRERASLTGPNCNETGYGTNLCTSENMPQPPAPPASQQSRSGQNTANGRTASRGKQHQHGAQSWRCRLCDAFNVGQPAGRCSCCGKLQQPVHHNSSSHMVSQQHGVGRRSQHGHKQLQQQGTLQHQQQQQNLQFQQLQRDVLLAAVSAAAAAAEKRADDKKVKRAAAAAAAAIAAESQQQHGSGRQRGSQSQCAPYVAQSGSENLLGASQNVGKDLCEGGVGALTAAGGGALSSENDNSFELFLTENFLRQQHHGHMGSGRLLTEDGYEDSTAAAAAAAAAAATLFPGLLQSLEHCSSSTLPTKGLPTSMHDAPSGRAQQQLTRAGSDNTNGAVSTSNSTPLGMSSDLLEGFSPLEREGMVCGRVGNCPSGSAGVTEASALCNAGSSGGRGSPPVVSMSNARDGVGMDCSTTGNAPAGSSRPEASHSFSEDVLVDAYGAPATDACFGNNTRSRLLGACGSYQGTGENVLSSAPGLSAGKGSATLPGCPGGGCETTPFSAATLLPDADTPFEGGTTTGMNIMTFQEFASAPQSTLYGDVITPGAESLNLLGDCRSLSGATPSSLLSRSESNSTFSARTHVVRNTNNQRRSGLGEIINGAHPETGDGSRRVDRCRNKNAVGTAGMHIVGGTDDDRNASHRDVEGESRGRGQFSGGGRSAIGSYPSGDRSHQNGVHIQTLAVGRSHRGNSNHQGDSYPQTLGQQPQQASAAAAAGIAADAALEQPFGHNPLQPQQLLEGAGASGDSPQCAGGNDFTLTRSSLPLSSVASSPSAGVGGVEELSPLAFNGGSMRGPLSNFGGVSGAGGLPMDTASLEALLPTFLSPVQILLLEAKEVADRLVEEFTALGYADPTGKAAEALRTSLGILGYTANTSTNAFPDDEVKTLVGGSGCLRASSNGMPNGDRSKAGGGASTGVHNNSTGDGDGTTGVVGEDTCRKSKNANWVQGVGGPHFSAPAMLAHPDEFKNPSSFLKIYGDPMCAVAEANSSSPQAGLYGLGGRGAPRSASGGIIGRCGEGSGGGSNLPIKGHNGNWVCDTCSNVNFPRRFRCNKCGAMRGAQGDAIVAEYAKLVYHQHLKTYRNLASRPGVDLPLKRLQGSAGGGVGGNGAGGSGAGNGGTKKSSSSYCSPSSNGGSTTTNSITGSTPSTPSDTANMTTLQGMAMSTGSLHGTSNCTVNYNNVADGIHPPGPEGSRAAKGPRMTTATHSSTGAGNPGSHRIQHSKGPNASETQSLAHSTRSEASGSTGNRVSCCFPAPVSTQGTAAAPSRFQPETAFDDTPAVRGIPHYVGNSPRANRSSTTKNSRVDRASLSGVFPDNSPQACRRGGNCNAGTAERQRVFGATPSTRQPRASHTHFLNDTKGRLDSNVCSANCSAIDRRQSATNGEKNDNDRSAGARREDNAFAEEKTSCNKATALKSEAGRGVEAPPVPTAVGHTPTNRRVSLIDAKGETPTLAIGKSAEGTDGDGDSSAAPDSTKDEILTSVIQMETRSAVISSEGNTNSHAV